MNKKYAGLDFPAWFDGKDVNEAAFCREFLSKNKLIYADNAFFTPDGRLTDPLLLLKEKIYAELECCAAKNILRTISNIVEIMKLVVHAESFPPNPDEIHVQNGTLRIDGSFLAGRSEIVRSRFPIDYNPQAGKSVVWLRFLSDLLYPEDIPTFQEYIGYPSWMRLSPAFHRRAASCGAFHPCSHPAKALPAKDSCGRFPYPASASCGRWGQRHCTEHSCTPVGQQGNRPFPQRQG